MRKAFACLISAVPLFVSAQRMIVADSYSPYIMAVDEYVPAPGQFVNVLPAYENGDDAAAMAAKCTAALADDNRGLVSLGGWGGYITFHFDHSIANVAGQRDIFIRGNAIISYNADGVTGGSCEPGVVMVSKDTNGNGLPDDEWYEISGSVDVDSVGKADYAYSLTYRRNDMQDIPWIDNHGSTSSVPRLDMYHSQEYYPLWITADEMFFSGTRLPCNAFRYEPGGGAGLWLLMSPRYGYADSQPNNKKEACSIDIGWAVDGQRNPVRLDFVDFVRVYTGVNQTVGNLGETSTEIAGAEDLHLEASLEAIRNAVDVVTVQQGIGKSAEVKAIYSADGVRRSHIGRGLNIIRMSDGTEKKIIK